MKKNRTFRAIRILCVLFTLTLTGCGISSSGANVPAAEYQAENEFMQAAVNEARKGIYSEEGGPSGALVLYR